MKRAFGSSGPAASGLVSLLGIATFALIPALDLYAIPPTWDAYVFAAFAVFCFSPAARIGWTAVLVLRVAAIAFGSEDLGSALLLQHFVAVRLFFVWALLLSGNLLASHRLNQAVRRILERVPYLAKSASALCALVLCVQAMFWPVLYPWHLYFLASFLVYVTWLLPVRERSPRPSEDRTVIKPPVTIGLYAGIFML